MGSLLSIASDKWRIPYLSNLLRTGLSETHRQAVSFALAWLRGKVIKISTSGSTGSPKQIVFQRHLVVCAAKKTLHFFQLKSGQTALICLNTQFIGGRMMLIRSIIGELQAGIILPSANPLLDVPSNFQPNFVAMVPFQLKNSILAQQSLQKINKCTAIIVGGGVVSSTLQNLISKRVHCPIYQTYGMTETISYIALKKLQSEQYYTAIPGISLATDKNGCLTIRADTSDKQLIHTHDLVKLTSATTFEWLGRKDFTINSSGIKIQPEVLENTISKINIISDSTAFLLPGHHMRNWASKLLCF